MASQRKRRVPKLSFTTSRGIGWHVSFRDPISGMPKKLRFDLSNQNDQEEAERKYATWLSDYLHGNLLVPMQPNGNSKKNQPVMASDVRPGSLIEVANSLLNYEQSRVRDSDSPRIRGRIHPDVYRYRRYYIRKFLKHINTHYGQGTVAQLRVDDLTMQQIEFYNQELVEIGLSSSAVKHAMQSVRHIITRAGRPEHGQQVLCWNWDSRDQFFGRPKKPRQLPSLDQIQRMTSQADLRGRTLIWTAIGLGFGASDLSVIRVGQIDAQSYDLRRGKTSHERFGDTPPLVWAYLKHYTEFMDRSVGDRVFESLSGLPLVSGRVDRVHGWWSELRSQIGEDKDTLSGFYVLRHLGATEFGSRPGCSISGMRRWLGHSASSTVADVYMRPIAPEHRSLIEWIREQLSTSQLNE